MSYPIVRDISSHNTILDWQLFAEATDMLFLRTSQNTWEDKSLRDKFRNAKQANMRIGLYHFMQPNNAGVPQANFFLDIYRSLGQQFKMVALDCEEISYVDRTVTPPVQVRILPTTKEEYTFWIMDWLHIVEEAIGFIPLIYTRKSFWEQWVIRSGQFFQYKGKTYKAPDWSRYKLWVANYDVIVPKLPVDWLSWMFWQDGIELAPGAASGIDRDWFNGTIEELNEYFDIQEPDPIDYSLLKLTYPCDTKYEISKHFGDDPQEYLLLGLPGHDGLDFSTPLKSPVYCMDNGIVEYTGSQGNLGNYIVIKHNDTGIIYRTIYCHLDKIFVVKNQEVPAGFVIAHSGTSGTSFPHLHISIRISGAKTSGYPDGIVDPLPLLIANVPKYIPEKLKVTTGVRVRLAPVDGRIIGTSNVGEVYQICGDELNLSGNYWVPVRVWVSRGTDTKQYGILL